ncbi:exodeoxyribonuclease VII small subunit [bacterium]|nr:exodeoxyribonuclease VII small subunit [bacterium]MCK4436501.1 exodeoxyribonuclease VII small subunit [bacterium]
MAEVKFEEALKKLENIVEDLEKGDLSLDEAVKKYEEGMKLAKICTKKLEEAEKKVEVLVKSEGGKKEKKPFDASKLEEEALEVEKGKEGDKELLF